MSTPSDTLRASAEDLTHRAADLDSHADTLEQEALSNRTDAERFREEAGEARAAADVLDDLLREPETPLLDEPDAGGQESPSGVDEGVSSTETPEAPQEPAGSEATA